MNQTILTVSCIKNKKNDTINKYSISIKLTNSMLDKIISSRTGGKYIRAQNENNKEPYYQMGDIDLDGEKDLFVSIKEAKTKGKKGLAIFLGNKKNLIIGAGEIISLKSIRYENKKRTKKIEFDDRFISNFTDAIRSWYKVPLIKMDKNEYFKVDLKKIKISPCKSKRCVYYFYSENSLGDGILFDTGETFFILFLQNEKWVTIPVEF